MFPPDWEITPLVFSPFTLAEGTWNKVESSAVSRQSLIFYHFRLNKESNQNRSPGEAEDSPLGTFVSITHTFIKSFIILPMFSRTVGAYQSYSFVWGGGLYLD